MCRKFEKFITGTGTWGELEWKSILHLASLWEMRDIRSHAIAHLSSCASPTAKVILGRAYDHPPWVRDGYLRLCLRNEPLSMNEAKELSLQEILGVAEAREKVRSDVISSSCDAVWVQPRNGQLTKMRYSTTYDTSEDNNNSE